MADVRVVLESAHLPTYDSAQGGASSGGAAASWLWRWLRPRIRVWAYGVEAASWAPFGRPTETSWPLVLIVPTVAAVVLLGLAAIGVAALVGGWRAPRK